jgi:hypothetical protein
VAEKGRRRAAIARWTKVRRCWTIEQSLFDEAQLYVSHIYPRCSFPHVK